MGVLAGILAAFGLDALWDVRTDSLREATYVEALSSEINSNRAVLTDILKEAEAEAPLLRELLTSVVTAQDPVPEEAVLSMIGLVGLDNYQLERAALTDLLNSGGIQYLDDAKTRRAVAAYEVRLNEAIVARAKLNDYWTSQLLPYFSEHSSLLDMFNSFNGLFGFQVPIGRFGLDPAAFVGNRDFANRYSMYLFYVGAAMRSEEALIASIDELSVQFNNQH